jgi:hypothetical protein
MDNPITLQVIIHSKTSKNQITHTKLDNLNGENLKEKMGNQTHKLKDIR